MSITSAAPRTTVFVSYCRKDKRWLNRLKVHLTPFDRAGTLDLWDDTKIDAGSHWRQAIEDAIGRAAASILLISPDFLASEFVATEELPKLLHQAERSGARILPIIIEPCELSTHPRLASFQALNSPDKPLAEMQRVEAERVLVRAVKTVGDILSRSRADVSRDVEPAEKPELFEQLQQATIALSILWMLAATPQAHTLTDLEKALAIRSRRRAFEVLDKLCGEGWIEKERAGGLTRYRLREEGARQLERLRAVADGPVRRVTLNGSTPCP